jgi:uncharacterized protein YjeT (DUF2065 family)
MRSFKQLSRLTAKSLAMWLEKCFAFFSPYKPLRSLLGVALIVAAVVGLSVLFMPRAERKFVSGIGRQHDGEFRLHDAHNPSFYGKRNIHGAVPRFPPDATLQVTAFDSAELSAAPF